MSLKLIYLVVLGVGIACLAAEAVALLVIGYVRLDWDYVYKRGVINKIIKPMDMEGFGESRGALGIALFFWPVGIPVLIVVGLAAYFRKRHITKTINRLKSSAGITSVAFDGEVFVVESASDNTRHVRPSHVRPSEVDSFIVKRRKSLGLCQTCSQPLCHGGGYKVCNRCGVRE